LAVWSLTPFLNELDVLEIRLATLDDVVDFHVIGESTQTQSGKPKPLNFPPNSDRFARWAHKIIYRVIEMPGGLAPWEREKRQRRCLWYGFIGSAQDKILLSDVDEIPHPEAVYRARQNILLCNMHVAKLNWRWKTPATEDANGFRWQIARIFPAGAIQKGFDLEDARLEHDLFPAVGPVGWHLSWMGDMEYKLAAFADQNLVPHADLVGAANGGQLFPGIIDQEVEWTDELPPYVIENKERFAHMMMEKPNG